MGPGGACESGVSGEHAGARDGEKFAAVRTHVVPPVRKNSGFSSAMMFNAPIMVSGDDAIWTVDGGTASPCNLRAMVSQARASGEVVSPAIRVARARDFPRSGWPCRPINARAVVSGN